MEAVKSIPSPLELLRVVEIKGKGRGLFASQPLRAGQIILRDSPIIIYSALPFKHHHQQQSVSHPFRYCAHCFRTVDQVGAGSVVHSCPVCSHLDDAMFCSAKCQSLALSSTHTPWVCQALNYFRNCSSLVNNQVDELQVQARYLVAAYNLAMVAPSNFQALLSLGCGESRSADMEFDASAFLHSLISSLPLPNEARAPSLELTRVLLAKDRCNAFGLMEPFSENKERSVRAYGIYPNASFFNHDCLPNACRFDYVDSGSDCNTEIIVRMIHDVPQGREICLSYFPVNLRYFERQNRLLDDYGFVCGCDRCKIEANWSDKEEEDQDDDEAMEEEDGEGDEQMEGYTEQKIEIEMDGNGDRDDDFPHAYFFLKYMCNRENCGGTLAPLPPSNGAPSNIMECNVCGVLKNEEE